MNPLTRNKNNIKTSENVRLGIINFPNNAKTTLTNTENIVRLSIFLKNYPPRLVELNTL